MNIAEELERLARLHKEGTLNDEEFAQAKKKLLAESERENANPDRSLGEAANRYVSFQMFIAVLGFILALIILFGVILPHYRERNTFRIEWPH